MAKRDYYQVLGIEWNASVGEIGVLSGRGLPPLHGGRRGDQHVVFELVVPTDLDEEQREAAMRLAEALGQRQPSRRR